ncbi:hypothetical protein PCANC_23878 [Puccinia coronata f. sp. avenae]|uniref:Uncharacterized protein n=1 Tax=Puccinia coronata f. sp. avenae TaxID=200324 RepID=A0A2N5TZ48_9BASI|nr:hypothetical protein PCANC_23878 [Puccinia coronata f. sp. avenae]
MSDRDALALAVAAAAAVINGPRVAAGEIPEHLNLAFSNTMDIENTGTMDIKNTVRVLNRACPDNLGVTTPYHPDTPELTPGQYSRYP